MRGKCFISARLKQGEFKIFVGEARAYVRSRGKKREGDKKLLGGGMCRIFQVCVLAFYFSDNKNLLFHCGSFCGVFVSFIF